MSSCVTAITTPNRHSHRHHHRRRPSSSHRHRIHSVDTLRQCVHVGTAGLCVSACFIAMADSKIPRAKADSTGYAPQAKRQRMMVSDADKAETHKVATQPGRVKLGQISCYGRNRGGQGILPLHAHDVAFDICENLTSIRRYQHVKLVEVPEEMVQEWLATNMQKAKLHAYLHQHAENHKILRNDTKIYKF